MEKKRQGVYLLYLSSSVCIGSGRKSQGTGENSLGLERGLIG